MDRSEIQTNLSVGLSSTIVTVPAPASNKESTTRLVLKLKPAPKQKLVWCEDVVDNEHMCKKSSKSS